MAGSKNALIIIIPGLLISLCSGSEEWPGWRGPFQNGSTSSIRLPDHWSKDANMIWVRPMPGTGSSTPIICNGRVFVTSTKKGSTDLLALCFEAATGKELWRQKMSEAQRRVPLNEMVSPSPVTDGNYVYFLFGGGDLVAVDYEGRKIWSRDLEAEYGNIAIQFGYSSSPVLYKGKLYITMLRRDQAYKPPFSEKPLESFLMALEPRTGKPIWKQVRHTDVIDESMESYATPVIFDYKSRAELVMTGGDCITSHDPETGKELWRFEHTTEKGDDHRIVPSLVTGNGLIFGTRYKHGGLFALKEVQNGTQIRAEYAWEFEGPAPDCSTPLLYDGLLYVLDGIRKGGVVSCLDPKTGRLYWQGRLAGRAPWRASLTGADGKLYGINEKSEAVVLAAGKEKFQILFRYDFKEKPTRSSIAAVNGKIFVRTAKNLYCIGSL